MGYGLWIMGYGLWVLSYGLWNLGHRLEVRFEGLGLKLGIIEYGYGLSSRD